jgi:hypothetical protein
MWDIPRWSWFFFGPKDHWMKLANRIAKIIVK